MTQYSEGSIQQVDDSSLLTACDFDSEETSFTSYSSSSSCSQVEIEGLEILLENSHLSDSDSDDDGSCFVSVEVDSLVLTRRRFEKNAHSRERRRWRRARKGMGGSVDSLDLARRRLAGIRHVRDGNTTRRRRSHPEMQQSKRDATRSTDLDKTSSVGFDCSEVDSLALAWRRLPSRILRRRKKTGCAVEEAVDDRAVTSVTPRKIVHKEHKVEYKGFHDFPATANPNNGGFNCAA
jgi:hypothetical protein